MLGVTQGWQVFGRGVLSGMNFLTAARRVFEGRPHFFCSSHAVHALEVSTQFCGCCSQTVPVRFVVQGNLALGLLLPTGTGADLTVRNAVVRDAWYNFHPGDQLGAVR